MLAVDRPGIGRSTFAPGRRIIDWPADVAAFADALELERVAVFGWSAGGPYALVCATALRSRLLAVGTVGSPCPPDWPGAAQGLLNADDRRLTRLARISPALAAAPLVLAARLTRWAPDRARRSFEASLAEPDVRALRQLPEARDMSFFVDVFRNGARGVAWDYRLQAEPWGFDPADVAFPVHLWHGTEDRVVALDHARALERRLGDNARLELVEGAGHFLFVERAADILAALVYP